MTIRPLVAAVSGLLGAGLALLILLLARADGSAPGFLEAVADSIARHLPSDVFVAAVSSYGGLAKAVLYGCVCGGFVLLGIVVAVVAARVASLGRHAAWREGFGLAGICLVLGEVVVLPLAGVGLVGSEVLTDRFALHLPFTAACIAYGATVSIVASALTGRGRFLAVGASAGAGVAGEATADGRLRTDGFGRRTFLGNAMVLVGLASISGSIVTIAGRVAAAAARSAGDVQRDLEVTEFGITPAVVPVDRFFTVSKDWVPLAVDSRRWRLSVSGLVDHPRDFTIDEVRALPAVEAYRTLQCVTDEQVVYAPDIGNQRWKGVRVREVLGAVGVQPGAAFVIWRCADGYHESLPIDQALDDLTWLVYEMGPYGSALTPDHGAPLRVLVANRYGMSQPKYVTGMILADRDEPGWWANGGWDTQAATQTYCRIDFPRADGVSDGVLVGTRFTVFGVAAAGDRGVSRVEVSIDGGGSWRDAELEREGGPISRMTWRRWRHETTLERPGDHVLQARATDGFGRPQERAERRAFPGGATGYPTVALTAYDRVPDPPTMAPACVRERRAPRAL